jgi:anti-sigma factor RsiW
MNQPDLNAYVLGETPETDRQPIEAYLAGNPAAALEVERLEATLAALRQVPDEEPVRRIAFVSDKVFEPSWWQRLWRPTAVALTSAAMLSAAIVTHGVLARPAQVPVAQTAAISQQDIARQVDAAVTARLDTAVAQAVKQVRTEADAEKQVVIAAALQQAEKKFALEREADRASVVAVIDTLRKQMVRAAYLASNRESESQDK